MSLLGDSWEDPRTMATLQLAAGLLGPGNIGQSLSRGLLGYQQTVGDAQERTTKAAMLKAQLERYEADAAKDRAAVVAAQRRQHALANAYGPAQTVGGEVQTPELGGQPMFSQGSTTTPTRTLPGALDVRGLIAGGVDPKDILEMDALRNVGRNKVARTIDTTDAQGRPITQQVDEFGAAVGQGLSQWKAPISVSRGDRTSFLDGATLSPLVDLPTFQSPDSKASNALGWANHSLARQRLSLDQSTARAEGATKGAPAGYMWDGQGGLKAIPGGPAADKPPNDSQSKALLFGDRMAAADKILGDLNTKGVYLSNPATSVGGVVGAAARWATPNENLQVEQAQRDFVNAVLRRESGAAISDSEFDNARKQYFPQMFDGEDVRKQKAEARARATRLIQAEVPQSVRANLPKDASAAGAGGFKILGVR